MCALGVLGEGGHAEAALDVERDVAFHDERCGTDAVLQALGHNDAVVLAGLGQKDDELIAAVAEGVVDEAQSGLDAVADVGEEFAADQVSVGVIDLLEVVEVEEDHGELVSEALRAVDLGFEHLVKMARVVETGAVVSDGEFLNAFHGLGVVDGDGGVVAESMQEEHLALAEVLKRAVDELDDPEDAVLGFERDADDAARLPLGHLVDTLGEAGIGVNVRNDEGFAVAGDPSGDAFAYLETQGFEGVGSRADGDGEVKLFFLLIDHEQGPGVWTEEERHLVHDGLQDGVEIEGRGERLGHVVEYGYLFQTTVVPRDLFVVELGHVASPQNKVWGMDTRHKVQTQPGGFAEKNYSPTEINNTIMTGIPMELLL